MLQKIIKTGNSLAVTIPSSVVKTLGLRPSHLVTTEIDLRLGRIVHKFTHTGQLPLFTKVKNN